MAQKLKVQRIAGDILEIQAKIAAITATLKPLKEMEDLKYEEMLAELKTKRMDAFKTDEGVSFVRAFRNSYKVTDEAKALPWAQDNGLVKIDTAKLGKALKGHPSVPEGIEWVETEYLTVKAAKDEQI